MAVSIRTFFATRWIAALVIVSILLLVIIPVSILLMRPAQELATQERDASECVSTVEQTPANRGCKRRSADYYASEYQGQG